MNDPRADRELVIAHTMGDPGALAAIYDRYADRLHDTATAMLGDRHEAADAMQDVFVVAAEKLGQLRDPDRLAPWLFAVLRHVVYRRTRRRGRQRLVDPVAPGSVVGEMAAEADPLAEGSRVSAEELAAMVRAAAAGLDTRDQLVLELSARQGLSGADLADALGVTAEQSHVLVHRMRDRVERSLGALVVARTGRSDCGELADLLRAWDGRFDVLVRKRVARHVERCETCAATKRRYAVVSLMSAAPVFAAPVALRDVVLARAAAAGGSGASGASRRDASGSDGHDASTPSHVSTPPTGSGPSSARSTGPAGPAGTEAASEAAVGSIAFDRYGFPAEAHARSRVALIAALVIAVLAVGGVVTAVVARDTRPSVVAAPSDGPAPTTVPDGVVPGVAPPSSGGPTVTVVSTTPTTPAEPVIAPGTDPTVAPDGAPPAPVDVIATTPPGPSSPPPPRPSTTTSSTTLPPLPESTAAPSITTTTTITTITTTTVPTVPPVPPPPVDATPPVVAIVRSVPTLTCPWTIDPTVAARVTDASAISGVVLSWSHPVRAITRSAPMTETGPGEWQGQTAITPSNGTWRWTVTAVDVHGNTGTAGGTTVVAGC